MLRAALLAVVTALTWAAPAHAAGEVAWSAPDCSLYALTSVPNPCPGAVFLAREDGDGVTRITDGAEAGVPTAGGDWAPSFSPDGRRIAFSRATFLPHLTGRYGEPLRGAAIWTMAADGSDQRRVMTAEDVDRLPHQERPLWTSGGQRLVFEGATAAGESGIYTVAVDGTDLRRISPERAVPRFVSVTPDGDVTYTTAEFYRPGSQAPYGAETTIWRADPVTGERVQIFFGDIAASFGRVSPNGRWMALQTERAGAYGIQTLAMDGSGLVWRVSDPEGRYGSVIWAEGSRMLFLERLGSFAAPETLSNRLWEMDVDRDGVPRLVRDPVPFELYDWRPASPSASPAPDELPPVVLTTPPPKVVATASAARGRKYARIPLIAADGSGLARVEASLARVAKGRCRYATPAGRSGPARSCGRPRWRRIEGVAAWRRMTDPLPRGRYALRVRARDTEGNRTRGGKVRKLILRSAPR